MAQLRGMSRKEEGGKVQCAMIEGFGCEGNNKTGRGINNKKQSTMIMHITEKSYPMPE